jgi:hypothetical protein
MLTAAFTHESLSHLITNLLILFFILFVLFGLNDLLPLQLRVSGGEAFVYGLEGPFFAIAGVLFLFWRYNVDKAHLSGSSAVVGSLLGATLFLCLLCIYKLPLNQQVRTVLLATMLSFAVYFSWLFVFGGGNILPVP